ncbi:acyltransferase family protein [Flavobacterium sp.]|jgi:peptidoglycan/LPS O-acetylase OafA/YrhL|uniref:acyltransferase family protein n=1 Tax=Flavobacterium sp. TaxID=239 RepID=UPI0037BEFE8C
MQQVNRLRELDFLRGIAIILVLFRHQLLFDFLKTMGWIGVDLFFVLSGFLVSGLLFKEYLKFGSINAKLFLIRRGFKIYPIFYLTYILYSIPRIYLHKFDLEKAFYELTFVQNYALGWGYAYAASWSLAVEEHFYFGLAFFLWLIFNKKIMRFEISSHKISVFEKSLIGIFVFVFLFRIFSNWQYPDENVRNMTMSHLRMDSLLFGVLISFWYHFKKEGLINFYIRHKTKLLSLSFLLVLFTPFIEPAVSVFVRTIGFTMLYISFGIVLIHFLVDSHINNQLNRLFSKKGVNFISKIGFCSYSIYIIHSLVTNFIGFLPFTNKYLLFIIVFLISIILGFFMTYVVEKFFLNYRNKYYPSRAN